MPTYQYACTECDRTLEQFQSFSDDALTVCPSCEGRLRKVYNAVGVVFKGSGFYRNDSRTDGKSKAAATSESSGSTTADSGSKDSGTSEKKTETKSEKKSEGTSEKKSGTSTSAA